ncbi:MAG: MFS transporter [Eggerthellaceae bacterium]|jgi:DHA2 family lincomycin resistance protein-like MFS transporter
MQKQSHISTLIILYGAAFIAAFTENIVNTGLVDIMNEFSVSSSTAQWLVTGYMIVTAIIVTVVAFLMRRFNLKTLFIFGSTMLIVGCLISTTAPTFFLLLLGRLISSVGTGIFIPLMMNTVLTITPRNRLGTYLSIGSCMITFGPALAPLVSGFMVTAYGWRSIFLVPIIIVTVLVLAAVFVLKPLGETERIRLDIASVILSALGLTFFVYGLNQITSELGQALIALAIGLCAIALFVIRQNKLKTPLLDLRPLRNPSFSIAAILAIVAMMTTFSMSVLLPLYYESATGTTALVAGSLILIPVLTNAITALIGGRTMDKHGEWPLLPIGFFVIAVSQFFVSTVSQGASLILVLIGSIFVYGGVGSIFSPSQTAGLKHLDHELNPHGVAIINTFVQVAGCMGPSLFVGILSSTAASQETLGLSSELATAAGFSAAIFVAAIIASGGFVLSTFYAWRARQLEKKQEIELAKQRAISHTKPVLEKIMLTDVWQVDEDATVYEAMQIMLAKRTGGLPVITHDGACIGFISDGDIMKALSRVNPATTDFSSVLAVYYHDEKFENRLSKLMHAQVTELATKRVITVNVDDSIEDALGLLSERRIKKVPVLENGKVVGTLSRWEVTRYLMETFLEHADAQSM